MTEFKSWPSWGGQVQKINAESWEAQKKEGGIKPPLQKRRGAARYSPYRQRLRPSAPGSLRREVIGAESATWTAPGQIEFEGAGWCAALTLAEPGALRLPGLQKGSEKCSVEFRFLLEI